MRNKDPLFNGYEEMLPIDVPYIMIIESDPSIAETLQEVIKKELEFDMLFAPTARDALQVTQVLRPLVFVVNEHLLDGDGVALAEQLSRRMGLQQTPIMLLSTNVSTRNRRTSNPSLFFMDIPFELEELLSTLARLFALSQQLNATQAMG